MPEATRSRDLAVLYATTFAGFLALGTFFPVVPAHLKELGMAEARVGYAAACLQLAFSVFQFAGGALADRLGPGRAAALVPLLYPPLYWMASRAATPLELVGWLVAGNVLIALQFPAMVALLVDRTTPGERGRAFTLFEFCFATGMGGGALAGYVTLKRFPFADHLLVAGIVLGAAGLARLALFSPDRAHPEPPSTREAARALMAVDRNFLAALVLIQVLLGAGFFGPFYALYAKTDLARPENEISLLLGLGNLAATFGSLFLARLLDRAGERSLAAFALLHAGLALPWLALDFASGLPFFTGVFLAGQLMLVSFQALLSRRVPERLAASAFGLVNTAGGVFLGLAPALFAFCAERWGTSRTPFHLAFAVAVAAAWLLVRAGRVRRRAGPA